MAHKKTKVLSIFGTRPEAIKFAPVIRQFEHHKKEFDSVVCVTAQHREMLDQILKVFEIKPDHDLNVMRVNQDLVELTCNILKAITEIIDIEKPDYVLVQGDTTTTFACSLAAFYSKVRVGHIEAGLRTHKKYFPFPEEINRHLTSVLADLHFAPTEKSKDNLLAEGVGREKIVVTGNTVVDALRFVLDNRLSGDNESAWISRFRDQHGIGLNSGIRTILVTGHRRESFGKGFREICNALSQLAMQHSDIRFIYPVHLNPNVQKPVYSILAGLPNVYLIPPLEYEPFIFLMNKSYLVLTDSGGVQEEAPVLGKPVLVMRDTTERPEGVTLGAVRLVGTEKTEIIEGVETLLADQQVYLGMSKAESPYGDGLAAKRIVDTLLNLS